MHASAEPTEGELVTRGPFKYWRHPIYAALVFFFWPAVLCYPRTEGFIAVGLLTFGLLVRVLIEETLLARKYPEYSAYRARTKLLIPFVF